jgi:ribonucleoside-diphosphate reductase alpha chain
MMAATQPFLSGAISKTINMPEESTVEDVMQAYIESWKMGLKAVAIYRDNSKRSQPLSAAGAKKETAVAKSELVVKAPEELPAVQQQELFRSLPLRHKLPSERQSLTHKFSIGGHEGYITVGKYDDGNPGEIFIKMSKEGSTLSGFMDGFALSVSIGLQYGVPLKALVDKFINTRFEPSGYTGNKEIPYAKSVLDYIGRWLGGRFISADYLTAAGETVTPAVMAAAVVSHTSLKTTPPEESVQAQVVVDGAPTCAECGMLMTPNGGCYKCENCGSTSGCS